jgi:hypothetical protein
VPKQELTALDFFWGGEGGAGPQVGSYHFFHLKLDRFQNQTY